jgi:hypothetical protein
MGIKPWKSELVVIVITKAEVALPPHQSQKNKHNNNDDWKYFYFDV